MGADAGTHRRTAVLIGGGRIVTGLPDLTAVLDAIDLQLAAGSPEVVLPRDHAELLAALLTDMLHTQPQRRTS